MTPKILTPLWNLECFAGERSVPANCDPTSPPLAAPYSKPGGGRLPVRPLAGALALLLLGLAGTAAAQQPVTVSCPPATNLCTALPLAVVPVTVTVCNISGAPADVFWSVNTQPVETNTVPSLPPPGCTNLTYTAILPPGTHTVDVLVISAVGMVANCSTTVTVTLDTQPPTLVCPTLLTGVVNNLCLTEIPRVVVQVSDNCAAPWEITVTQTPPFGTQVGVGTNWITITATDPQGNIATCQVPFVALDPTPPVVTCPQALSLPAGPNCQAALPALSPTVADDCTPTNLLTVAQSPPPGTLLSPGNHPVTLTVSDTSGHTVTCQTTVTVLDTTPPVLNCPTNLTLTPGPNCLVTLPALNVSATDNCTPGNQLVVTQSLAVGTVLPPGTHTVTVTVCDAANNCASCTVLVTVPSSTAASWTWSQAAGGALNDAGRSIARLPNGDLAVVGDYEGTMAIGPTNLTSLGSRDIFVARFTAAGSLVWAVSAGGSNGDWGYGVTTDTAGHIYISGYAAGGALFGTLPAPGGGWVGFVARMDGAGNFLWVRQATDTYGMAASVAALPGTNGVCVGGWFGNPLTLPVIGPVPHVALHDGLVLALDSAGNYLWGWAGGTGGTDAVHDVAVTPNGQVLATGRFGGGSSQTFNFGGTNLTTWGGEDAFVVRLSANGALLWATNGGGANDDWGIAIGADALGRAYVTGTIGNGPAQFGPATLTTAVSLSVFVAQVDPLGQFLWATNSAAGIWDGPRDIAVTPGGQSFVTGHSVNGIYGTNVITGFGDQVFVAKLDAFGQFLWATAAGGPGNDFGSGLTLDASGNCVFVTGFFQTGPGTFPPTPALPGVGGDDAFVAQLCQNCVTNTPPAAQCPPPLNLACAGPGGAPATLNATVSDADGDPLTVIWTINGTPVQTNTFPAGPAPNLQTVAYSGSFAPGTNLVTLLVLDAGGAAATCATVVTALPDTTPPTLFCKGIIKLYVDQNCQATLPALMPGSMSDNCTPASQLIVTQNPPPGTLLGLGLHNITLTVTDAAGNTAVCVRKVWVQDNLPPIIQCPPPLVITACQTNVPALISQTLAVDNCDPKPLITQLPPPGTPVGPGTHQIVLTATDSSGNSASCVTTLTVQPVNSWQWMGVYDTGVDNAGNPLPNGAVDPHWLLIQSPATNGPGPAAYVGPPAGIPAPGGLSKWIRPAPNPTTFAWGAIFAPGVYRYVHHFYAPPAVAHFIGGNYAADNYAEIWLNGQYTGNTLPPAPTTANFTLWHGFAINSGFIPGATNVLEFRVFNFNSGNQIAPGSGTPTGLRVDLNALYFGCPPVCFPPFIAQNPVSQAHPWGGFAVLSVTAGGSWPLYYQWLKNGSPLPGATNATLVLSPLTFGHQGHYAVIVSNACGAVTSQLAFVQVKGKKTALIASWSFRHPHDPFAADLGEPLEFIPSREFQDQPELAALAVVPASDVCPPPDLCPGLFGGRDAPVLRFNPWFDGTLRMPGLDNTAPPGQRSASAVMDLWLDQDLPAPLLLWKDTHCNGLEGALILWPGGTIQLAGQRLEQVIQTRRSHRLVLVTRDDPAGLTHFQLYVDGRPVLEAAATTGTCAGPDFYRQSLEILKGLGPAASGQRVHLGGLQLYDQALTGEEIALLGSPENGVLDLVESPADEPTTLHCDLQTDAGALVLRLRWTGTGFVLQEAENLVRPDAWRDSTLPVRSVGATGPVHNEVTVPLSPGSAPSFFRLKTRHDTVKNSISNIR